MPFIHHSTMRTTNMSTGEVTAKVTPYHLVQSWDSTEVVARTVVDFGLKDAKGRAVGMSRRATHQVVKFHEQEPAKGQWGGYECRMLPADHPAEWFEVRGISTRNGAGFGSADVCVKAPTLEAALAEFDARVERARKLAARKFGAPVAA